MLDKVLIRTLSDESTDLHLKMFDGFLAKLLFLSVIGEIFGHNFSQDPSVCKSNQLHFDILRFSFIKLGHVL